ncbi:TIGR03618 family F420-dependent PPOX class oxidoreductase [Streptomyces sp. NPDC101234]|uniref:TIGR03618 family F420-dependent PPOX class oxidoreductase n=1 Tax=Streptomyces sp. NPDC101234 TaxID=3366138 RepID=UPI0037FCA803
MTTSSNTRVTFDSSVRALLDGRNFASVATPGPGGAPRNSVVWIQREGDTVLFSSVDSRQKVRNLRRDPRVGLTVFDLANPYHSAEIRGRPRGSRCLRASRCAGIPGTAPGTPRI